MNDDINLGQLLNKAETAHLEHKSIEASPASVAQAVGAFLNTGGGTILIEAGAVEAEARSKIDAITKELRETIAPPALWSLVLEESDQGFLGNTRCAGRSRSPLHRGRDNICSKGRPDCVGGARRSP